MPRPSNTDARRRQIVDGLRALLPELGYERASIAAIAQAAGLSSGLVHYHFHNKQEILVELVDGIFELLHARYARRLSDAPDTVWAPIDALVDAWVARGDDRDATAVGCWVAIGAEAVRRPEVRTVYARAMDQTRDLLVDHLETALRAHDQPPERAPAIAATLLAAIQGAFQLHGAAPGVLPEGFAAEQLKRTVRALVACDADPCGDAP